MAALCQPVCNYTNIVTTVWLVTSISLTQAGLHFQGGSPGPDPLVKLRGLSHHAHLRRPSLFLPSITRQVLKAEEEKADMDFGWGGGVSPLLRWAHCPNSNPFRIHTGYDPSLYTYGHLAGSWPRDRFPHSDT